MLDALQIQIHIQFRSIKMMAVGKFHVEQLFQGHLPKPREIVETKKMRVARDEQPEAVRRDVQHFSF
jgi:hypothetical protein